MTLGRLHNETPSIPAGHLRSRPSQFSRETATYMPNTAVLTSMTLSAFKPDMQLAFVFDNTVWSSYASPWLQLSAQDTSDSLSLEACQAFASCIFGKHFNLQEEQLTGRTRYGKSLSRLRMDLSKSESSDLAALLVPMLLMLMLSSATSSREDSEIHIMGLYNLLLTCGPAAFQTQSLLAAFSSCRATLVIFSLITKRRLFLEEEEWRTVPWSLNPSQKGGQDELVDILVAVSGLLEDRVNMTEDTAVNLRCGIGLRLQHLYQWRWSWEAKYPESASEEARPSSPAHTLSQPAEARRLLRLPCFTRAVELSLYNAVLLSLVGLLHSFLPQCEVDKITRHIASSTAGHQTKMSTERGPLVLPAGPSSLRCSAIEIARLFEFQLLHARRSDKSALFWLFPVWLARKILDREASWKTWIDALLDSSQETRGYGSGTNAFGLGDYIPDVVD